MNHRFQLRHLAVALAALSTVSAASNAGERSFLPNMLPFPNPSGLVATVSTTGKVDLTGPFFESVGTNGRTCVSCHQPSSGWTITPQEIQARFDTTDGTDPIFRTNDGSNSPIADVSTIEARRAAYSMLLGKGLIRVSLGIPPDAEFELIAVDDPYGYASAKELSLFRRPLPSTNLKFLSTVMWDGRETFNDAGSQACILGTTNCYASIHFDLSDQANGATTGHAEAIQPLTAEQRKRIVDFESSLFTAQIFDDQAGELTARHALGGPQYLSGQDFYFGMNDVVSGDYRTGALFDPKAFKLYDEWNTLDRGGEDVDRAEARRAVARGQTLFNSKPIRIRGVKGLNDELNVPVPDGTCTTCHDTPNAGNHSIPAPLDIGLTDASRRTPDLPLYTLRQKRTPFETIRTTDPGRALITGKWKDIARFKGPILRALASRAPYFHNGSARDLNAVVDFYDERFGIELTDNEKDDLVAFLQTL
jgi:cytochrome c peroxidase